MEVQGGDKPGIGDFVVREAVRVVPPVLVWLVDVSITRPDKSRVTEVVPLPLFRLTVWNTGPEESLTTSRQV